MPVDFVISSYVWPHTIHFVKKKNSKPQRLTKPVIVLHDISIAIFHINKSKVELETIFHLKNSKPDLQMAILCASNHQKDIDKIDRFKI